MTTDASISDHEVYSLIRVHRSTGPYGHFVMTLKDVFDDYKANSSVELVLRAQCGSDNKYAISHGFYGHKLGIESRGLQSPIGIDELKVVTKFMSSVDRKLKKLDEKHGAATTMAEWSIRVIRAIGVHRVRVACDVLQNSGYNPMNWPVWTLNTNADLAKLGKELIRIESQLLQQINPQEQAA